jgi:uncharacterized repeat protein (TIGR01451 family)
MSRYFSFSPPVTKRANFTPSWRTRWAQLPILGALAVLLSMGSVLPSTAFAATIQGVKFNDLNGNGVMDVDEPVMANEMIFIRDENKSGFVMEMTDENGNYSSDALDASTYSVWTTISWGWKQTTPLEVDGGNEATEYVTVDLSASQTETINFGIIDPAAPPPAPNTPPTVEKMEAVTVSVNEIFLFQGKFNDPDEGNTHTYHWDFGDGNVADTLEAEYAYTSPGTYQAVLTVTDNKGDDGSAEMTVTVKNTVPTVNIGRDLVVTAGNTVNFNGVITDPDGGDSHTFVWDFGDGNSATIQNPSHIYVAASIYTVTLTVTDKHGDVNEDSLEITVEKAPPVVDVGADITVDAGEIVNFKALITDIDSDKHNFTLDFGDGNNAAGEVTTKEIVIEHAFVEAGTFTVRLEVEDADKLSSKNEVTVVVRDVDADPCGEGIATVRSVTSGEWDNKNTWDNMPDACHSPESDEEKAACQDAWAEEWVTIEPDHSVILPEDSGIKVKGLCVSQNAVLESAPNVLSDNPLSATLVDINATTFKNKGIIRGINGKDGSGPLNQHAKFRHATAGSSILIRGSKVENEGQIIAGNGGNDSTATYLQDVAYSSPSSPYYKVGFPTTGGTGGQVEIYAAIINNRGVIQSGVGGAGDSYGKWYVHGLTKGGDGGIVRVIATDLAQSTNVGQFVGGCGGHADIPRGWEKGDRLWETNDNPSRPGYGGNVTVNVGNGHGQTKGCTGSTSRWDPTTLKTSSTTRFEGSDDVTIFGGDDWVMELHDLVEGAISAKETITIAVGKGGVVDLRGVKAGAFKAGREFKIFADEIMLDESVTLEDLVEAPSLIKAPSKILHSAAFSGARYLIGEPSVTATIRLTLLNTGPLTDTYTLSVSDSSGWTLGTLPTQITVNSMRHSVLSLDVTLPAIRGEKSVITVTATSQGDPETKAVMEIQASVRQDEKIFLPPPPPEDAKADYTFVIDDTGSMGGEIGIVASALETFITEGLDEEYPPMVELITFKDNVTSRVVTNDMGVLITQTRGLRATGGGDCPEASILGLEKALDKLGKGGQILFATDASAHRDATEIVNKFKENGNKVHVILAGSCGNVEADKAFYQNIADGTGGKFYFLPRGALTKEAVEEIVLSIITEMMSGFYKAHGTVLDKLGNPIPDVTVTIGDKTTVTDETGYWEIEKLPEGEYTAIIKLDDFTPIEKDFAVGNDEDALLEVKLESVLDIKVVVEPRIAKQDGEVTYTITITNKGEGVATGVTYTDTLPEGTSLVSLEALDGGHCDASTISCSLPDLTPGATATVQLVIHNEQTNRLVNKAQVAANEYPADVRTTWTEVRPYLSGIVSCIPNPVMPEGILHCESEVELSPYAPNTTATGIEWQMRLPRGVELEAVNTDYGICDTSNVPLLTCELTDLSIDNADDISQATIDVDMVLKDPGLLVLTHETKVTANEYPAHMDRERTNIFIPEDIEVDIAFVIDVTGSMQEEINGVIKALKMFIDNIEPGTSPLIALVVFRDEVTVEAFTRDLDLLQSAVENLKASGGGTCSEASVEALLKAIPHTKVGGQILFATDASPYADSNIEKIIAMLRNKGIRFNAMITGDCTQKDSWNLPTDE